MRPLALALIAAAGLSAAAPAGPHIVAMPGKSPLVTIRVVVRTGAADDPAGKAGAATLTAAMLADAGTRGRTYKQVIDDLFPLATDVSWDVDKEMSRFSATTHVDNLEKFYAIFRALLLEPGWRQEDFTRVRDDLVNGIRVNLRGNNDEELGKEALYQELYRGTPYATLNLGSISALESLTIADVQAFYRARYTRGAVTIGLAGGYPADFEARVRRDFSTLPAGTPPVPKVQPPAVAANRLVIVDKKTRAVAYSIGYPISVRRGDPDFAALLMAQSCLGQHRTSGRLFERIRQQRGINYGDYAYIEYFPGGMFRFEPEPNLARQSQIFQIWIRPVEPDKALFSLRLALYELDKLVRDGLTQDEFERTRNFLSKNVNLLMKTKDAELGYAIDSRYYGIPAYDRYLRGELAKLTREKVNQAIRRHLRADKLTIVAVSDNAAALRDKILAGEPSPMHYNSPKPAQILEEDKTVERYPFHLTPENVQIVPLEQLFR